MSDLFRDPGTGWAALLVVVLPLVIIGVGEVEERLRQRDSEFRRAVAIVRTWVVPLFAAWAIVRALFDTTEYEVVVQLLASAGVVAAGTAALAAVAVLVTRVAERPRSDGQRSVPRLLLALPRLGVIIVITWVLVAGVWNVDLSAAMTALGVTSLVISFALQDTLSGLASGFLLLSDRPFQPGDWIRVGDLEGRVVDINWRSSRIQNRDGDLVIVPNGQLAGATIVNYDEPDRFHRVVVQLQVAFVNPPTSAKEMLLSAARATPGVLEEPAPRVRVVRVDDPLMGYEVDLWIEDYAIAPAVKSDFGSLVWYHSHRLDVPLPSPAQDLYLYDGVQAGAAGRPDRSALRRRLQTSVLFDELDDDALDELAAAAEAKRYALGESVSASTGAAGLYVLWSGSARIVVQAGEADFVHVLDLEPGDVFGLFDEPSDGQPERAVVAQTDCEVVVVEADTATGVISRDPTLSRVLDQLAAVRRRRVDRALRRVSRPQTRHLVAAQASPDEAAVPSTEGEEA